MTTNDLLIGIIILIFFLIAIISLIIQRNKDKIRTIQLIKIADELGLTFQEKGDLEKLWPINKLSFVINKATHLITDLMKGDLSGVNYTVFDFSQNTLSGNSICETIILFQSNELHLPFFTIRRKYIADNVTRIFDNKNVYFDRRPIFSKKHYVSGKDPGRVRRLFSDGIFRFFENREYSCAEGFEHNLFYYRYNKSVKPGNIKNFIDEGFEIYNLFKESSKYLK